MKLIKSLRDRLHKVIYVYRHILAITVRTGKTRMAALFILGIIGGATIIPTLFIDKILVDTLINSIGSVTGPETFTPLALLVILRILISALNGIINNVRHYLNFIVQQRVDAELDQMMARKNAELDLATLESPEFKDKYTKIQRESLNRVFRSLRPMTQLPAELTGFISSLVLLIALSPLVVIGVFIFSLPQLLADTRYIKKWYDLSSKVSSIYRIEGWLSYYLIRNQSFMELKLLNLPTHLANKMKKLQGERLDLNEKLYQENTIAEIISQIPLIVFEIVTSIWLVAITIAETITIGSFQLYLRALSSAHSELRSVTASILSIVENYIYIKDFVWFMELEPTIETSRRGIKLNKPQVEIEFQDVWFKYAKDKDWILKGVSFKIDSKENIALVGENGTGKSTLIKLLARFYDPNKGKILINDIDLKEYDLDDWRKHLSVLFQEFEMYPFSVKETIGYGEVENIDQLEDIKKAAEMTRMQKFIEGLPKKYNNPLDPEFEKGVRPSMGQRQRLGISRMLFRKNAQVIIMDEPTASVDPQAEEDIFKELVKHAAEKILIFVTQRFSTVRLADRIFVMDNGKIIEQGTHKELMAKKGKYAHLFNLQAKGYL